MPERRAFVIPAWIALRGMKVQFLTGSRVRPLLGKAGSSSTGCRRQAPCRLYGSGSRSGVDALQFFHRFPCCAVHKRVGEMAPYVRNLWYMAAWEREIEGDALLERTLLEPWLIFRLDDGSGYAILANRCPHRFAALSKDRRQGNAVACPYHGLTSTRRGSVADCSAEKCAAGCALVCARVDAVDVDVHQHVPGVLSYVRHVQR